MANVQLNAGSYTIHQLLDVLIDAFGDRKQYVDDGDAALRQYERQALARIHGQVNYKVRDLLNALGTLARATEAGDPVAVPLANRPNAPEGPVTSLTEGLYNFYQLAMQISYLYPSESYTEKTEVQQGDSVDIGHVLDLVFKLIQEQTGSPPDGERRGGDSPDDPPLRADERPAERPRQQSPYQPPRGGRASGGRSARLRGPNVYPRSYGRGRKAAGTSDAQRRWLRDQARGAARRRPAAGAPAAFPGDSSDDSMTPAQRERAAYDVGGSDNDSERFYSWEDEPTVEVIDLGRPCSRTWGKQCARCGSAEVPLECGAGCGTPYCSRACARAHWQAPGSSAHDCARE